jgi:hypothetical protein
VTAPAIVYVTTDQRGHDIHGDGTHQRPFRTVARARSDYPDALICLDDVHNNMEPRQLTEVGEEVGDICWHPTQGWTVVFAAVLAGLATGYLVQPVAGLLVAAILAVGLVSLDRVVTR